MQLLRGRNRRILKELDEIERGVKTFYKYLLYGLIALVTGFVAYLFQAFEHDANKPFLQFYFGVGYLVFLGWAIGQLVSIRKQLLMLRETGILYEAPLLDSVEERGWLGNPWVLVWAIIVFIVVMAVVTALLVWGLMQKQVSPEKLLKLDSFMLYEARSR